MHRILVLIPVKPGLHADLLKGVMQIADGFPAHNPSCSFRLVVSHAVCPEGPTRVARLAALRQLIVEQNLTDDISHVLWIDADIVSCPPEMPTKLLDICSCGVVAPMVLVDCERYWFYDTHGFVRDGKMARTSDPPFDSTAAIVEMDSVGCFLLIHADVYRNGGKHAEFGFSEWQSIGVAAKQQGRPVLLDTRLSVLHAFLPKFGEGWH